MLFRRRTSLSVPVSPGVPTTPTTPSTPGSPFGPSPRLTAEEAIALANAKLDAMCSNARANESKNNPLLRGAGALKTILDVAVQSRKSQHSVYEYGLFFDKVNHYDGIFGRVFGPDVSIEYSQELLKSNREYYEKQSEELNAISSKMSASAKAAKGSSNKIMGLKETIHDISQSITRVPETEREPSRRRGSLSASPSMRRTSVSAGKMPERQASLQ